MRKWKQLGFNVIKDSFDQLPTAVCFFDPLGRIVLCNRQMYRLSQHLFQRDMQYLGEVEAALASPPDGVKKLSDMEHTYRFPDKTVWQFERDNGDGSVGGNLYTAYGCRSDRIAPGIGTACR